MTDKDLISKGVKLANLIAKHGGWIDENDDEIIRFPSPHALLMFQLELEESREAERQ
jgi:hypothetical protein